MSNPNVEPEAKRTVEWYRQCPRCWEGWGGVGHVKRTIPTKDTDDGIGRRYYKCDRCGHNFSRDFEEAFEITQKRIVRVIKR